MLGWKSDSGFSSKSQKSLFQSCLNSNFMPFFRQSISPVDFQGLVKFSKTSKFDGHAHPEFKNLSMSVSKSVSKLKSMSDHLDCKLSPYWVGSLPWNEKTALVLLPPPIIPGDRMISVGVRCSVALLSEILMTEGLNSNKGWNFIVIV